MLPFAPLPHQIQASASGDPSLHQPWAFRNQMHSRIPLWSIPGAHGAGPSSYGAGNVVAGAAFPGSMAPPSCPNLPPMMQNSQAGIPSDLLLQIGDLQGLNQQLLRRQLFGLSRGAPGNLQQFQGQLQSPNVFLQRGVSFLANNLPQNFNFVGAMPNVYSLSPQTMTIQENQVGGRNSHALSQPQVHLFEVTARVVEPKNAPKHKQEELRCWQTQQFKNSKNMKTNVERTGGIVVKNSREGKPQGAMNIQSLKDSQRRHPIKSSEKKIQQWVRARRKNYPTRLKIKKKLVQGGVCGSGFAGGAKLRCQRPNVVLARRAESGVQVPKLRRSKRLKAMALAAAKEDISRMPKIIEQFPSKEAELGVEVPPGCLSKPNHEYSREANNSQVLKVTGNIQNKSNRKRKRKEKRRCIMMVDSSRELKMKDQFPNKKVKVGVETVESGCGCEPNHRDSKEASNSGVLKRTDNIPDKSNKKRRIPWRRERKAMVE